MDAMPKATEMEIAAIVVMLCAPSPLNLAWARPDQPASKVDLDKILDDLGFSSQMKAHAHWLMGKIEAAGGRKQLGEVSSQLSESWGRQEPHPVPQAAKAIVAALNSARVPDKATT